MNNTGTTEAYIFPLSSEDTLRQNPQDKKGSKAVELGLRAVSGFRFWFCEIVCETSRIIEGLKITEWRVMKA
ncbi:hypothetical protein Y1Q_0015714 [Alligator mississippiensis]|uniref:Uncharacterized protein n=1 Tax=Alligator mississippiensis TaxID=8496 RepID=A0A151NPS2_ALLMI|nr:hypothetical protein Y1Q_0015714 [Alligator mississippiensis]